MGNERSAHANQERCGERHAEAEVQAEEQSPAIYRLGEQELDEFACTVQVDGGEHEGHEWHHIEHDAGDTENCARVATGEAQQALGDSKEENAVHREPSASQHVARLVASDLHHDSRVPDAHHGIRWGMWQREWQNAAAHAAASRTIKAAMARSRFLCPMVSLRSASAPLYRTRPSAR